MMKPVVMVRVPRPTRMAGVLAWLVGFALCAAVGLGTVFVVGSVMLGILSIWARHRSARPVPSDAPPVPDPSEDVDAEALRALRDALFALGQRERSDLPPQHVDTRMER